MDVGSVKIFSHAEIVQIVKRALNQPDFDGACLKCYSVERGSKELIGFLGEYYKLDIQLNAHCSTKTPSLNFFVKSVPLSNEYHRDECERKGVFAKETRIYTEILAHMQKHAPTKLAPICYYTRDDLIVLEDLCRTTVDYRQLHSDEVYTLEHHKVVLRQQARFHAASLAWESTENMNIGDKFKDILYELQLNMKNEWYETGVKGIVFLAQKHPKFQSESEKKYINEKLFDLLAKAGNLTEPSNKWRNVLCHRDSWDRNIFFQYNADKPVDCVFVDFQLTRYSPPAIDVVFFLYVTTSTRVRREEIFDKCLDYYYQTLHQTLRDMNLPDISIARKDFDENCKQAKLAALILMGICQPLLQMPEGIANKMRAEEPERFDYYMNSERSELFERLMHQDVDYKNKIMNTIEELVEYIKENDELLNN